MVPRRRGNRRQKCGTRGAANVFHAGDLLICYDKKVPGIVEKVLQAGSEILAACVGAGGTIFGEHGIGIEKMVHPGKIFPPAARAGAQTTGDYA